MIEKDELHNRNRHNGRYDFDKLILAYPELKKYVAPNKYGNISVDFFDPQAVKALNKALLIFHYGITYWEIPQDYLCPPIPGRADYIHYIGDLVGCKNIKCLDIGVGANCIYPIIGCSQYDWKFVGTDIDSNSIENAQKIIDNNEILKGKIELRVQANASSIFEGVVRSDDFFDVTICNPPFHDSKRTAERVNSRKLRNLTGLRASKLPLNFGGASNELWCKGGELEFLSNMIAESKLYQKNCRWFTSLVSRDSNLDFIYSKLMDANVAEYRTINMQQGNKISRIVAWRF